MLSNIAALNASNAVPAPSRSSVDLDHWKTWKASPTDTNLTALLHQVKPLIQNAVQKWSGTLAKPMLEAEGKRLAVLAFHDYDPNRGAALGTHVTNNLMKLSRISYTHQNVARLPENKVLKFHTYQVANAELNDTLGRPASVDELADHLGWSIPHLTSFQKDIAHQEVLESGGKSEAPGGLESGTEDSDNTLDFIHHDLTPQQKVIFEHLTGYGGVKVLPNQDIMKKLRITQGVYSYQKRLLVDHLENVMKGR